MNTINWNIFPTHVRIYKSEKIQQAFRRDKTLRSLKKYKKMYPWVYSWRTRLRVVKNSLPVFWFCGFRYFWKWGNIRKRVRWNRRLRLVCTLYIGVSRKFHLHFTLMFWLVLRPPQRWQLNLKVSRVSCWPSKHSPSPASCLNHNNPQ